MSRPLSPIAALLTVCGQYAAARHSEKASRRLRLAVAFAFAIGASPAHAGTGRRGGDRSRLVAVSASARAFQVEGATRGDATGGRNSVRQAITAVAACAT
jgi:hypothetical protein